MKQTLKAIASRIDQFNNLVGRTVAWLTLVMVILTCGVVLARYAFDLGSIALQEGVMFMHGIVFMLAIAYTFKEQGHVRVDVFYERLPPRMRIINDLAGHLLLLLPVSVFLLWTSIDYVSFSWSLREASGQPGGLPGVYLIKTLIPLMALLLILQGFSEIINGILKLVDDR